MDYSDAEALTRNNFLEGYLNLKDTEGVADLHLPFLGFTVHGQSKKLLMLLKAFLKLVTVTKNVAFNSMLIKKPTRPHQPLQLTAC